MALLLSLLAALAVFLCGPGGSLGCDLPQTHIMNSRENSVLLGQMRRISPFLCLQDRRDFRFPEQQLNGSLLQKAEAMTVLQEMLQQTFLLFLTERSSAAWDPALLHHLRTGILRQLQDLEACLVEEVGEEGLVLGAEGLVLAVKRYFQRIQLYLEEKKYSDCAWEVVRLEILRALSLSIGLRESLSTKNLSRAPSEVSHLD